LLQPPAESCRACGEARPEPLRALVRPTVERRQALQSAAETPSLDEAGKRNVAIGFVLISVVGVAVTRTYAGGVLLGAAGAWGAQLVRRWTASIVWRHHLGAIPPPRRPTGTALIGTIEPFERTLPPRASDRSGRPAPVLVGTAIHSSQGLLLHAIEAVPFWLVIGERRLLVAAETAAGSRTSALWPHTGEPSTTGVPALLDELRLARLPVSRETRSLLRAVRTVLRPGDRVSILGEPRQEQLVNVPGLASLAGYRDSHVELLGPLPGSPGARGAHATPLWIEPVDVSS
jgi:hypothetical protein